MNHNVFISHSSDDAEIANKVCQALESNGIPCWIAPRDVPHGADWSATIIQAIKESDLVLLLFSRNANESDYVYREVERAAHHRCPILPVRLEEVAPDERLELFISVSHWLNASKGPQIKRLDQITAGVRGALGHASTPSATTPPPQTPKGRTWKWAAAAASAVALMTAGIFYQQETTLDSVLRGAPPAASSSVSPGEDLTASTPGATQSSQPQYHAFVFGITNYQAKVKEPWANLRTAVRDAEQVADTLESDYGFNVHRLFDSQATLQSMISLLDEKLVQLGPQDSALIYFAGHGYFDEKYGEGYWVPYGASQRIGDRPAREQWLSNALVSSILDASNAKHILVIADSCFSGSLFRGEAPPPVTANMQWYRRAVRQSSRYLISSGNLEPVLDGAGKHSVFAFNLIDFLKHTEQPIFSASGLGQAIRERVSSLTGQHVRMAGLKLMRHQGGEFVFMKKGVNWNGPHPLDQDTPVEESARLAKTSRRPVTAIQNALELQRSGAGASAQSILTQTDLSQVPPFMLEQLQTLVEKGSALTPDDPRSRMIEALKKQSLEQDTDPELKKYAKPRIIACLGPRVKGNAFEDDSKETLYQFGLSRALMMEDSFTVMAREHLDEILKSLQVGSSDLSDQRARTELKKILPASLLLVGDLLNTPKGEHLFISVIDVETAETVGTFMGKRSNEEDEFDVCTHLAEKIAQKIVSHRPLSAQILSVEDAHHRAGIGTFHGADSDMTFQVIQRAKTQGGAFGDFTETQVGSATLMTRGEMTSLFSVSWDSGTAPKNISSVWIQEAPPSS